MAPPKTSQVVQPATVAAPNDGAPPAKRGRISKKEPVTVPPVAPTAEPANSVSSSNVMEKVSPNSPVQPQPSAEGVSETPMEQDMPSITVTGIDPDRTQEIVKMLQKMQRTINKTQRSVTFLLQQFDAADPTGKRRRAKKEPSGFAKPSLLSDELCDFLGVPYGTKLARTEVTKKLTSYIRENNLQNPNNKREINLDSKLRDLLKTPPGTVVTFFNIQKYLTHYKKDTDAETTEDAVPHAQPMAVA